MYILSKILYFLVICYIIVVEEWSVLMYNFLNNSNEYILKMAMRQSWRNQKYSYKNTARRDYGFLYLLSGRAVYNFDGKSIELHTGDIICLPKGSYYEAEFDVSLGKVKNYLINFDILNDEISTNVINPFLYHSDGHNVISSYFKDLVDAFNSEGNSLLTKSLFYRLLYTLASVNPANSKTDIDSDIDKGAVLLKERLDLSVEDIAKKLHLSRSAFQKRFKDVFGVAPVKYRTLNKLEKSKIYLDTTDMPIKEIAEKLEFYDLSYFYKVFEKHYSVTPKKYRDNLKKYL